MFHFQSKQKLNISLNNYYYSFITTKIVIFETKKIKQSLYYAKAH